MAQMNLSTEQKQTHRHGEQTCDCQGGGGGKGMDQSLELVDANHCIYCSWFTMSCQFLLYSKVIQLHTHTHIYIHYFFHTIFHHVPSQVIGYSSSAAMQQDCIAYPLQTQCKQWRLEWISNEVLLYSTGNCIQFLRLNMMEDSLRKGMYIFVWLGRFAVQEKLAQHCKSTIL